MMDLKNLDLIRLLPLFMREDTANRGLAAGVNKLVTEVMGSIGKLSTWNHLDELSEEELDGLAWELNVLWYDFNANLNIKRDLIRNCIDVHRTLGTKWAVESVVRSYFGDGYIEEWFEYGGEPGHFMVYSSNPSVTGEKVNEFMAMLGKVKRASSILDGVIISLSGEANFYAGTALHETGAERYNIGSAALY